MGTMLSIDHLVLSVADVADAVRRLHDEHGLGCSRLPGRDGETAVCPLGGTYLRVVRGAAEPFFGWVAAAADLTRFAQRAGEPRVCPWEDDLTGVGLELVGDGLLPPVVARRPRWLHPSGYHVYSPARPVGVTCLELQGDAADLRAWLGDAADELPLNVTPGPRALLSATVATVDGDATLTAASCGGAASLAGARGRARP